MKIRPERTDSQYFLPQWKLESCSGPPPEWNNAGNSTIYDRCCLRPGRYTLTCINEKSMYGWKDTWLEIDGKKYCDDFIGFRAMRPIFVNSK